MRSAFSKLVAISVLAFVLSPVWAQTRTPIVSPPDDFEAYTVGSFPTSNWFNNDGWNGNIVVRTGKGVNASHTANPPITMSRSAGTYSTEQYALGVLKNVSLGSGSQIGLVVRHNSNTHASGGRNAYLFYLNEVNSTFVMARMVNNSVTTLGTPTSAASVVSNDEIAVEVTGTGATVTLKGYLNDVEVYSTTDTSADRILTAGRPGVVASANGSVLLDDFEGGDITVGVTPTVTQEGFRWGVDDGNEAAHTWEAAQDTSIEIANNQARLLRVLADTTADYASTAYTLRAQKNGAGGYVAVPVGATTAGSITNQTVAASADDAQEAGGTVIVNGTTIGASLDNANEWAGIRFTGITIPAGATITSAVVGVVPSGTGEDEPLVTVYLEAADNCAQFTTAGSSISSRSRTTGVAWSSADLGADGATYFDTPSLVSDVQAVINRGGWASGQALCVLINSQGTSTRDLTIEAYDLGPGTNPPRLSLGWTVPNEVYVSTSGNITAGGEATTARLTAPAGKTTSDFTTGRRWDDENGSDSIDIAEDFYTELEWAVTLASTVAASSYYDFRVYAGASAFDTYGVTPRWTIPAGGGGSAVPIIMQQHLGRAANDDDFLRVANSR